MGEIPKKSRKKAGARSQSETPGSIGEVSGGQVIYGGIHARRDVVMGDQFNLQDQRSLTIQTPAEFVAELQALKAELAGLKAQAALTPAQERRIDMVEADLQEALEEAQTPRPLGERIRSTLNEAKTTLDAFSGSIQSAVDLGVKLGGLALIAAKVFGG
jgi:hypothetical protein